MPDTHTHLLHVEGKTNGQIQVTERALHIISHADEQYSNLCSSRNMQSVFANVTKAEIAGAEPV